ncbi:hypothetical protein DFH07DRAFT_1060701 [Mycena maculata]|uniref:Uncharacterized protein n=1 Tax=Mycena maculata TaxID=230809 RepID=A0AAD7J468_9AGAR|nr:hypothetical protein DFH07DRAFT_1060701 [Mycena maculata]
MSAPTDPQLQEQASTLPIVPLEHVVSPTPSAKKRFSALQHIKKLGGKFKKSKKVDDIPETQVLTEEVEEVSEEQVAQQGEFDAVVEQLDIPDAPEPATLAEHIRTLITALPPRGPTRPPIKTTPPPLDAEGRPILPAVPIKDPKLIKLLSDPEVMNGSVDDDRPSVWAALEALPPPADDVQSSNDVMLYCPLRPTDESKVELATTRTVEVPVSKLDTFWQSRWDFLWSMTVGLVKSQPAPTKLVKLWVPSPTKISFQAMWWGYRMYLPPPVMASLNSDEAEVVKIATTVTAALTWFLANVSVSSVPVPLQPAFLLLQKLGPYAGYIGTFIAWIWGAVENADKGNGVVLTATWILPVALIPSAIKIATPATDTAPTPSAPATAVA